MTLDNLNQKQFLLEFLSKAQFPDAMHYMVYETKQAVANAKVNSLGAQIKSFVYSTNVEPNHDS